MEDLWRRYERFAPLVDRLVVTEYDFVCNDDETACRLSTRYTDTFI